jgi:hypothetical protein
MIAYLQLSNFRSRNRFSGIVEGNASARSNCSAARSLSPLRSHNSPSVAYSSG